MRFRRPAEISDFSGSAVEADGHLGAFDDHRHASLVLGMFQHLGQFGFVLQDIGILDADPFLLEGFTSRLGVRSAVLAVNDHPIHNRLPFFCSPTSGFRSCQSALI
jgi:hypothetical protein